MPALVDTNILVYRFDPRDARKQQIAVDVLRSGIADDSIRISHQAVIEFFAAVTRRIGNRPPLLSLADATREAEELMLQLPLLFPNEDLLRNALRATAAYGLSWFDANMWAYADYYALDEILSEDFQDGRVYGRVRARNPFRAG